MMKNSGLLKWTNNKNNNNKNNNKSSSHKNGNKNWLHPPEALQKGHVAYLVKFLGSTEVDQPKGIEVVKEGIRKLKFNQQLKKAEGTKTPKVELTVSIDGVAIHEPKTKKNLHQYPLHRISYCADDKAEKRFFSFIAKEADSDKHTCFVFVSDKLAEEITLTIGQAFDLAYRRFVETSGREVELRRQIMTLQKKLQTVEEENQTLKTRITQLSELKDRPDIDQYMKENNITDLLTVNGENGSEPPSSDPPTPPTNGINITPPPVPPRNGAKQENNNLLDDILSDMVTSSTESDDDFNPRADEGIVTTMSSSSINTTINTTNGDNDFEDDFNPRAEESKPPQFIAPPVPEVNGFSAPPALKPPPRPSRPHEQSNTPQPKVTNGFSSNIFDSPSDPFGPVSFTPTNASNDILAQFNEMKVTESKGWV